MFNRVYVEITDRCNLSCAFCPGTRRPLGDMSPEAFAAVAEKLWPVTRYLYFHIMGEPLLHPRLGELLAIAAGKGFKVCLTTNGTLLAQKAELLKQAKGLHKISVSLHSFEGNDGTDMEDYLTQAWESCEVLAQKGVLCVLRLWNEGGLEQRNGEIEGFLSRKTGVSPADWPQTRQDTWRLAPGIFLERDSKFDWPDAKAEETGTQFCHGLRSQLGVLWDGTVVPCCLDHEGDLALGNLLEQDLEEILEGPRARAIYEGFSRRQPSEELCKRCGYASRF